MKISNLIALVIFLLFVVLLNIWVVNKRDLKEPVSTDTEITTAILNRYMEIHGTPYTDREVYEIMYIIYNDKDCYQESTEDNFN